MAGIWNTTILKVLSHPNMLGLSHTESSVSAVFQEKLFHTALLLTCYRRVKGKLLPFRLQELILDNGSQPKTLNKGYRLSNQCLSTSLAPPPLPNFSHCSSATGDLIKHLATLSCAALQDKTHACQKFLALAFTASRTTNPLVSRTARYHLPGWYTPARSCGWHRL